MPYTAIYMRVSSQSQDYAAQESELKTWAERQQGREIRWFSEKISGAADHRPEFEKMLADIRAGQIDAVVVWRVDRAGRSLSGLLAFMQELVKRKVNLISLRDSLDLATPGGRLQFQILGSVAEFERSIRAERQQAGIRAAKAAGRTWGGRPKGSGTVVTESRSRLAKQLQSEGRSVSEIALELKVSRPSVYNMLRA